LFAVQSIIPKPALFALQISFRGCYLSSLRRTMSAPNLAMLSFLPSYDHTISQMTSTEETLAAMRREMRPLLETAMEGVLTVLR
jgi:hypothetical protein